MQAARVGVVEACSAPRTGSMPARQSTSSHSRFPRPAIARLVHDHRLDRRAAPARRPHGVAASVSSNASGPESVFVGIELDGTESAWVAEVEAAAVGERQPESVPRRHRPVARVQQRITRGLAVDEHAPAHPEMETEHRPAIGVDEDQLARGDGRS